MLTEQQLSQAIRQNRIDLVADTQESVHLFRSATDVRLFHPGETVFAAGDSGDFMYAVRRGEVDLLVNGNVVESVGAGGLFGEMSLIDGQPRSATAVARTECELAAIDERQFQFMTQNTPRFAISVLRIIAHRLRRSNDQLPV
jgi:CRP-like cAMP-binding protein